ncbi:hypothetical protein ANCDUO_16703 [Ancylostoma duodenale]|uniref:Fork-head domain-containing protein n=1 Tax=Ancylostoma duodenale TaxID=51022 RepID=A0A0C2CTP4_9BILA|nr:hypothetical protein ANCDUO_16703 [Ancylostoma duodenale]
MYLNSIVSFFQNSIRHNLSLHSRFMRIQNEGAGKSSWWVINPDAKPGRNPRRVRASTLDTTSKATLSKKLKGARKRIHDIRAVGGLHSGVSSLAGSQTESPVAPPPSYLELSSVRNQSQLQNPLLRTQLASVKFPTAGYLEELIGTNWIFIYTFMFSHFRLPLPYQTYSPWPTHTPLLPPSSCAAVAQANSVAAAAALPSDLESLTLPDQPLMDFEVESLLRHELSQTTDHRLNFDNL